MPADRTPEERAREIGEFFANGLRGFGDVMHANLQTAIVTAILAEREACAKLAVTAVSPEAPTWTELEVGRRIARAIRTQEASDATE